MAQEHYGLGDVVGDVARSAAQNIAQHNALPLREKNLVRVHYGAWLITACAYAGFWTVVLLGDRFSTVAKAFLSAPLKAPHEISIPVAVWAALLALGLLWFWVGVRGSRGPRDVMKTFWVIVRTAIWAALFWWKVYMPNDWGDWVVMGNVVLMGIYIAATVSNVIVIALLLRGPGGSASHLVTRQIQQTAVVWQAGTRRKF